jgi:phenylacetate-CoA ligase
MIKVKGVNMFPAQFEELLAKFPEASSEYQVMIDHLDGKDILTLFFETAIPMDARESLEQEMSKEFKSMVNVTINPKAVNMGDLPRSEKKAHRIFDNRY